MELEDLPVVNALLNTCSAVLLSIGFIAIKRDNKVLHKKCMVSALLTSCLFLTSYLYYHFGMQQLYGAAHTKFVDPSWFRPYYLVFLATHLIMSISIVPMVIITVYHAVQKNWEKHKRMARITFPCWMYVSVTGVMIYLILYQIFPQSPGGSVVPSPVETNAWIRDLPFIGAVY